MSVRSIRSLAAARRGLARKPQSYEQVWLSAALLIGLPTLVIFSALGILNGWAQPWPQLAFVWPPVAVVLNGLARSVWLSRHLAERGQ
jgi:hypothetical protein